MSNSLETALAERSSTLFCFGNNVRNTDAPNGYSGVSEEQFIDAMLNQPHEGAKLDAPWWMLTTYRGSNARNQAGQEDHGQFWGMALDVDTGNLPASAIDAVVQHAFPNVRAHIHSTASATPDDKRWRAAIMFLQPVPGAYYAVMIHCLRERLVQSAAQLGEHVDFDSCTNNPSQVMFWPTRGAFYEAYPSLGEPLDLLSIPNLNADAKAEHERRERERRETDPSDDKDGWIGYFNSQHNLTSIMVDAGFEWRRSQKMGDDYWHPKQSSTNGSPTLVFECGKRWDTKSGTLRESGIGRANKDGTSNTGDAFDVWCWYKFENNRELALLTYRAMLLGYDPQVHNMMNHATLQSPQAVIQYHQDHGRFLLEDQPLYCCGVPINTLAQAENNKRIEREALELQQLQQQAQRDLEAQAVIDHAHWKDQTPYHKFNPTKLDELAWNAPGIIGEMVRWGSNKSTRCTLIPLLAGAMTAVGHFTQGKVVLEWEQHISPPGLAINLVANTGKGKGDASKLLKAIEDVRDRTKELTSKRLRKFKSGAAVTKGFSIHKNRTIVHEEAAADAKASQGDSHNMTMIAALTDAMTSFVTGLDPEEAASKLHSNDGAQNPTVSILWNGTPERYAQTVSSGDAEGGWLGRWLNMTIEGKVAKHKPSGSKWNTPEHEAVQVQRKQAIQLWVRRFQSLSNAPHAQEHHEDIWMGEHVGYHIARFTPEAEQELAEIDKRFTEMEDDMKRTMSERNICARGVEVISKIALNAGLACVMDANNKMVIDKPCVVWAEQVFLCSLQAIVGILANEGGTNGVTDKIRERIHNLFNRLEGKEAFARAGRKVCRLESGKIAIQWSHVMQNLKSGSSSRGHNVVRDEVNGLVETEELICSPLPDQGSGQWLYLPT